MPPSLAGKAAIVTGGRRGIGRAIALALAEAGADVAVCDRVADVELDKVAEEVRKSGRRALAIQTDITKKADVDNLVQKTVAEFGTIDILVNNAATNVRAPLLELDEEGWNRVIDTDLKGYYLCSQAAGKVMVKQKGGNIINIASTAAVDTTPQMGAYSIAKAGVVMLTRMLAIELAQYNIRVNAVAPSIVKTKFSRPLWDDPKVLKEIEAGIPLGRLAEPEDIIGSVLFLASEASAYITGHTLVVDGGSIA